MFKKNINELIDKDTLIIECKKRAKALQKEAKSKGNRLTLMQCQSLVAIEMGYADWFSLHNTVKLKYSQIPSTEVANDSMILCLFEEILANAISESASDIHIKVTSLASHIRMRVDGELMDYRHDLKYLMLNDLCTVIWNVLSPHKTVAFDPYALQQAVLDYEINQKKFKLLYQSIPIYPDGYEVVLRIKPMLSNKDYYNLTRLGYSDSHVQMLDNILQKNQGAFFLSGVTGSGKSTTIRHLLDKINYDTGYMKHIASIEEVVESPLDRITQIPLVMRTSYDYTKVSLLEAPLKGVLRSDYDIIHIDYRFTRLDKDILINAIRNKFVISSLHASASFSIVVRLQDFGLDNQTLGSDNFLSGLSYQMLSPVVCPHCSVSFMDTIQNTEADSKLFALADRLSKAYPQLEHSVFNKIRLRGKGCGHCKQRGIKGRTLCAEIIEIDDKMKQLIREENLLELRAYWQKQSDENPLSDNMRGKTAKEHAVYKMFQGLISPVDIENNYGAFK